MYSYQPQGGATVKAFDDLMSSEEKWKQFEQPLPESKNPAIGFLATIATILGVIWVANMLILIYYLFART
jgi:hypothetical protein